MTSIEPIDEKKSEQISKMQEYIDKYKSIITITIDESELLVRIQYDYGNHGSTQYLSKDSAEIFINQISTMHQEFPSFTEGEIKVYLAGLYT